MKGFLVLGLGSVQFCFLGPGSWFLALVLVLVLGRVAYWFWFWFWFWVVEPTGSGSGSMGSNLCQAPSCLTSACLDH